MYLKAYAIDSYFHGLLIILGFTWHSVSFSHHSLYNFCSEFEQPKGNKENIALNNICHHSRLNCSWSDGDDKKCIDKVEMIEETEYDDVVKCEHSYDKRCHTTYVTNYLR